MEAGNDEDIMILRGFRTMVLHFDIGGIFIAIPYRPIGLQFERTNVCLG